MWPVAAGVLARSAKGRAVHCTGLSLRHYKASRPTESMLILGGVGIALGAVGAQHVLQAYKNKVVASKGENSSGASQSTDASGGAADQNKSSAQDASMDGAFASITNSWAEFKKSFFAKGYYDGGFEDKMSRREAALILGVRESATAERIKEAHRRILLLNHPDRGGSALLAAKINEAKDLLLKGTGQK